jgi:hypothetical protein
MVSSMLFIATYSRLSISLVIELTKLGSMECLSAA